MGWLIKLATNKDTQKYAIILVVILILLIGFSVYTKSRNDDYSKEMQRIIGDQVEAELEIDRGTREKLQGELDAIRWEIENIHERIQESAKEREEVRSAIDQADNIDAVDRILKQGISGHSGYRGRRGK